MTTSRRSLFKTILAGIVAPFVKAAPVPAALTEETLESVMEKVYMAGAFKHHKNNFGTVITYESPFAAQMREANRRFKEDWERGMLTDNQEPLSESARIRKNAYEPHWISK